MILTDYRFSLDTHEINSQITLTCKKGETGRCLFITITEEGKVYNIGADCHAVFTATKPDGKVIFNDCEISGNVICYKMTPQTATAVGLMDCEIRLYGPDNLLIISPYFNIHVYPPVYDDGDIVESTNEVSTLTALISEADALIEDVNTRLANGDFIPKISVGTVKTLPAGSVAEVTIGGTAEAPVFNFGIPQGEQGQGGQGETVIPDTELSLESTKPVQNRVIAAELAKKADSEAVAQALAKKADSEAVAQALGQKADAAATTQALGNKVEKVQGKDLSTNDYTNEEKNKLKGIEAGANKYTLPVAGEALGGVKDGGDISISDDGSMTIEDEAVTEQKIAPGAVSQTYFADVGTEWLGSKAPYTQTVLVDGLPSSNRIYSDIIFSEDWETALIENEDFFKLVKINASAGVITLYANEPTTVPLTLKLTVFHGDGLGSGNAGGEGDPGGTIPAADGITLVDRATGAARVLCVSNGELTLL